MVQQNILISLFEKEKEDSLIFRFAKKLVLSCL